MWLVFLELLVACQPGLRLPVVNVAGGGHAGTAEMMRAQAAVNTATALALLAAISPMPGEALVLPPTSTPIPTTSMEIPPLKASRSHTAVPTTTRILPTHTATAVPTEPPTSSSTDTPTPPPTNLPPPVELPPTPVFSGQYLLNPSFEEGWYHMHGLPELQLPHQWTLEWEEGRTGFGTQVWDQWYRPETRVLPHTQLPESERSLFIQDGQYTIKIFKGNGPISFRLLQDVSLPAGDYRLTIRAYPDLVMAYDGNRKIFSDDPFAGEIRMIGPHGDGPWLMPAFGVWNQVASTFTLNEPATVRLGIGIRARFALMNNGWFFDDWKLERAE